MNAFHVHIGASKRAVLALVTSAVLGVLAQTFAPYTAFAEQQFTNGENRDGSYFDHLVDGLAGDPQGGEGVNTPDTSSVSETDPSTEEPQVTVVMSRWAGTLAFWKTIKLHVLELWRREQ